MCISEIQHAIIHLQETMPGFTARVNFSQEGCNAARTFYDIDMIIDSKVVYCTAYHHTLEAALNDIREQREHDLCADLCEYCGERLDGEVCSNMACSINLEAA